MATNRQIEQLINAIPDKRTAKQIFGIWANRFVFNRRRTALNVTGSITAGMLGLGVITSSTAAAVTGTLEPATSVAAALGLSSGSQIEFTVDNVGGANVFTIALGTGFSSPTSAITGGNTLTVAAGSLGKFLVHYVTSVSAVVLRLA